jgi:hypothetical protein
MLVLWWLSAAQGSVPTCADVAEVEARLAGFQEATAAHQDALWPGWNPSSTPTGVVMGDSPWVAWVSAPTARVQLECGDGVGLARAGWVRRSLGALVALAQVDSHRQPEVALLVDLSTDRWEPREWLAIHAHEQFHVHQFSVMDLERFERARLGALPRAWAQHRERLEPALQAELVAGWRVVAEGAEVRTYLDARSARLAVLEELDADLVDASALLEELEGVARYIEARVETDPEVTAAYGGPRDAAEALEGNALSFEGGQWWYATGFVASRVLEAHVPGWKARVLTEGFEPLLQGATSP